MSEQTEIQGAPTLDEIFVRVGNRRGVDPLLLKAIAMVESSLNPAAINTADNESIGLMQILCRPDGRGGCSNRFDVDGWAGISRDRLFDAETNVDIGAQILAWNIRTYGMPKALAVYNAWDQRSANVMGPFKNQSYVDKILANYRRLSA